MEDEATNEATNVVLGVYDPATMLQPTYTVVFVGKRNSGKTVMMQYFMKCMAKKLDMVIGFIPTADTRREFEQFIPRCFLYPEFDEDVFHRALMAQREVNQLVQSKEVRAQARGVAESIRQRHVGVILDDCMYDKTATKGNDMRWLFMNGRHDNLFHMNAIQYVKDIDPGIRTNIDVVVVFPDFSPENLNKARETLLPIFSCDRDLERAYSQLLPHEALVFDSRAYSNKGPCLFTCKAEYPLPTFRVGSDAMWAMYYRHMVRPSTREISDKIKCKLLGTPHGAEPKMGGGGKATKGEGKGKKGKGTGGGMQLSRAAPPLAVAADVPPLPGLKPPAAAAPAH